MDKKTSVALALGAAAAAMWCAGRAARKQYSFAQKVVVITGGSRGLGLVLARHAAREGARLVLIARDRSELQRAHDELAATGADVSILPCDLTDRDQAENALLTVLERMGRVDVLINNAGIIEVGPLEHMKRQDFERAIQLHFWAPFNLMWTVIPQMRARRSGRIVNIASIGGKIAVPHLAAYSASKFALVGLSDAFRTELAQDGICVTTVCPGMLRTGSHVNAGFKGNHSAEFDWFAASNAMPLVSMSADRAAKKILDACRQGRPELTLTLAARAASIKNALFPSLFGHAIAAVNRLLPGSAGEDGNNTRSGRESRTGSRTPRWMTRLADDAIERNNESAAH